MLAKIDVQGRLQIPKCICATKGWVSGGSVEIKETSTGIVVEGRDCVFCGNKNIDKEDLFLSVPVCKACRELIKQGY